LRDVASVVKIATGVVNITTLRGAIALLKNLREIFGPVGGGLYRAMRNGPIGALKNLSAHRQIQKVQ
jgi:hypothetical protein